LRSAGSALAFAGLPGVEGWCVVKDGSGGEFEKSRMLPHRVHLPALVGPLAASITQW
jgi:hypothetical protein